MRKNGVPGRRGIGPCDGARYPGASPPGIAHRQPEVHIPAGLQPSQ